MTQRRRALALIVAAGALVGLVALVMRANLQGEQLPAAYAGLVNPLAGDPAAVAAGSVLFQKNCTTCHGEGADGRGPAAGGLIPPPANFRASDSFARHSDAYLYYRLSEGKPGTAMPSFRGVLDEQERWALVAYLRTLRQGNVAG